ncbi:MAG: acyl carrier protein [Candidatus Aminicenantes bacterium]|jgi:acyl carrier protein
MRVENEQIPQDIIRNYIMENVNLQELDDDFDIFEAGLVNSLFAIELMTFLEKAFDIKVTMDDLDMDNFKTVNSTGQFVQRKKEGNHV